MNCPVCKNINLVISDRQGIEIDYCPQCRGVWLDRGELDKIIERSFQLNPPTFDNRKPDPKYDDRRPDFKYDDDYYKYGNKKKKRGFLDDLFDF